MAKKPATFEVRFIGDGIGPESVPLRAVSDALSAIQDLASGRDTFNRKSVPEDKTIGLVKVSKGSAIYSCVSKSPAEAKRNLSRAGKLLATPEDEKIDPDFLLSSLRPINTLSTIAKSVGGTVEIVSVNSKNKRLLTVTPDDYGRISNRVFLRGETTITGKVERAGGATDMRCLLRVPGRHRILYCDVESKDLVRRLGQHLYEPITATGTATWIHQSWAIYEFKIRDFTQPRLGNPLIAIKELRDAGLSAWDDIEDPSAFIEDLR